MLPQLSVQHYFNQGFNHKVSIPWKKGTKTNDWNLICAYAMEQFGLPGQNFVAHATEDNMDFYFKEEKDAIFFSLRCA